MSSQPSAQQMMDLLSEDSLAHLDQPSRFAAGSAPPVSSCLCSKQRISLLRLIPQICTEQLCTIAAPTQGPAVDQQGKGLPHQDKLSSTAQLRTFSAPTHGLAFVQQVKGLPTQSNLSDTVQPCTLVPLHME